MKRAEKIIRQKLFYKTEPSSEVTEVIASYEPPVIGPYLISEELLGSGSYSSVHFAFHLETLEPAAVKIVPKELYSSENTHHSPKTHHTALKVREMVLNEVSVLSQLSKPFPNQHILGLKAFYETELFYFLVLEHIEGQTLEQLCYAHNGPLPEKLIEAIWPQLVDALSFCHSHSIVHMDLKLDNIMIENQTGRVVLVDFGHALLVPVQEKDSVPLVESRRGSQHFAAPEKLQSRSYEPYRAELWSLGVCLFALCTYRLPFLCPRSFLDLLATYQQTHLAVQQTQQVVQNPSKDHSPVLSSCPLDLPKRRKRSRSLNPTSLDQQLSTPDLKRSKGQLRVALEKEKTPEKVVPELCSGMEFSGRSWFCSLCHDFERCWKEIVWKGEEGRVSDSNRRRLDGLLVFDPLKRRVVV